MNPFSLSLINILVHALAAAPAISQDISDAFSAHWGKDHVQQAVQGVNVLQKIIGDLANVVEPPPNIPPSL